MPYNKVCVCTYLDFPTPIITYLILTYVPKNQKLCQEYETNLESKLKKKCFKTNECYSYLPGVCVPNYGEKILNFLNSM